MKTIRRALLTTKNILNTFIIFDSVLSSLIAFLIMLSIVVLIKISIWWAIIAGLAYLLVHTYNRISSFGYKQIETIVPELNYQLTTVADNLDKDNEVVNALNNEVLQDMKKIKTSYFISPQKVSKQVLSIAALCIITVLIAQSNMAFLSLDSLSKDLQRLPNIFLRGGDDGIIKDFPPMNETLWETNLSEILGEDTTITELGTQEISIQIDPLASELDLSSVREVESREFSSYSPKEVKAMADVAFEEQISKRDQEIVKEYFNELARS